MVSLERYEIYQSQIGFDNKAYSELIADRIKISEINIKELSLATSIDSYRIWSLLNRNFKFRTDEIKTLSNFFNIKNDYTREIC